jgi:hypothetical protein
MLFSTALLLLALVGCVHDAYLAPADNASRYTQVVDAAPGLVSKALEAGFDSIGISVLVKRDGSEIRLVGQTRSRQVFCVYVRPLRTAAAKSAVSVKWDAQPDEDLWESMVAWLGTLGNKEDTTPKEN